VQSFGEAKMKKIAIFLLLIGITLITFRAYGWDKTSVNFDKGRKVIDHPARIKTNKIPPRILRSITPREQKVKTKIAPREILKTTVQSVKEEMLFEQLINSGPHFPSDHSSSGAIGARNYQPSPMANPKIQIPKGIEFWKDDFHDDFVKKGHYIIPPQKILISLQERVRKDIPTILKNGWADRIDGLDLFHAHVIEHPKKGWGLLYHSHEYDGTSSSLNKDRQAYIDHRSIVSWLNEERPFTRKPVSSKLTVNVADLGAKWVYCLCFKGIYSEK